MGEVGKEGVRPMVGLVLEAQVTVLTCNRGSGGLGVWGMGRGLPGLGAALFREACGRGPWRAVAAGSHISFLFA